jgi:hypothetical protein
MFNGFFSNLKRIPEMNLKCNKNRRMLKTVDLNRMIKPERDKMSKGSQSGSGPKAVIHEPNQCFSTSGGPRVHFSHHELCVRIAICK